MAIAKTRYVKKGEGLTAVAGAQYFSYTVRPVAVADPGPAGTPGRAASLVTYRDIVVRVYGSNLAALLALIGSAAEGLTVGYQTAAGVNRKKTFKKVAFTTPLGTCEVRSKDSGGKISMYGVEGHGCWLTNDTLALMVLDAADA